MAGQEFCQYCHSPLNPSAGSFQSITPGQAPTPKSTSDLEPVLPEWLRNARASAQQSYQEEPSQSQKLSQPQQPSHPQVTHPSSGDDLLAGLRSQAEDDEEEDIPDWLANITGEAPKAKKPKADSADVSWVELGGAKDFSKAESEPEKPSWQSAPSAGEKNELTDWTNTADVSQPSQPFSFDAPPPAAVPSDEDWLRSLSTNDGVGFTDSDKSDEAFTSDTPDWLKAMDADSAQPSSSSDDTPDWIKAMDADNVQPASSSDTPDWLKAKDAGGAQPVSLDDTPDWLKAMGEESAQPASLSVTPDWFKAMGEENAQPASSSDTPDWFKAMGEENAQPASLSDTPDWFKAMGEENAQPASSSDTPDWLKAMGDQGKGQDVDSSVFTGTGLGEAEAAPSSIGEADWLKDFQSVEEEKPPTVEKPAPVTPSIDEESELPSWLKAAAPQSSIYSEPPAEQPAIPVSSSSSDWLNAFKSVDTPAAPIVPSEPTPDADSLFTELPDWLSVVDESAPTESIPAPITNADAISPGELPSWVQAMRPVDAGISQAADALTANSSLETRGALAGLQGVLPAAPGYAPTSKPKPYSIKLQANDEQLSHAALLEQILSAEASPVHIDSFSALRTSRGLRWMLVLLFFVILPTVLFMRTTFFPLPDSVYVPLEVGGALQIFQSIPQDAPVLTIFDYQPARAGEVESVAVPMFDQLILRGSRLTFISTTETGAVLAERLISSDYLAGHNYQSGVQYLNLGYLPGGQMGIRSFAENPLEAAPYTFSETSLLDFVPVPAWTMPPLAGVTSLPQFAVLILITDDADSARAWIEQTTSARGKMPFVVVSSAQAAPMIHPYYASGQISGLISGLHGSALIEQYNNQKPGTARIYWDAYSIGLLLAVVLIFFGGLINLTLGLRDRAAAREAK